MDAADYREQAVKLFPWVCGRRGREFNGKNLRELTVHHKVTGEGISLTVLLYRIAPSPELSCGNPDFFTDQCVGHARLIRSP
jgi:hypothetical protein